MPAEDLAEEAFIVLREALRKTRKVGLGQLAMRGREYVVALKPCGRGLLLETLRYSDEVNKAASYFRDISDAKPDPELLDLATSLIEKKAGKFDAGEFHDRYVDALRELIARKRQSRSGKVSLEPADERPSRGGNVIDLMAALKKSLDKPAPAAATRRAAKKPAASSRKRA